MPTTMTTAPAADKPRIEAATQELLKGVPSRKGLRRPIVAISGAVLLAAVGWVALGAINPTGAAGSAAHYTVVRRSFPVIEEIKGELKAAKTTDLKSKVEGRTTIIWLIEEGKTVEKDDLLVKLASDRIDERILQEEANEASAIAGLEAAEKDLEILIDQNASDIRKAGLQVELLGIDKRKYIEGDARKSRMATELEIERATQMLERAKLKYEGAKSLHQQRFITMNELLADEFGLREAERALETANLDMEILETYTEPKELRRHGSNVDEAEQELERVRKSAVAREAQKRADVEAKRAKLLNTQTQLRKFRTQKENTEIRAPTPGLVVYFTGHRYNPQQIAEGSEVYERQTIVTLPDPSVMLVKIRVHEAKTSKIKLGQTVKVEIEGLPDQVFDGKITKIAPLADSRNQWLNPDLKEYETEITLEHTLADLKPGVTARTEILIAQLENVLTVPLQTVFSKSGRHYVFALDDSPIEVTLGLSSTDYVEVATGLKEGDRIQLAVSDDAMRNLPDLEPVERVLIEASMKKAPPDRGKRADKRHGGRGGSRGGGSDGGGSHKGKSS